MAQSSLKSPDPFIGKRITVFGSGVGLSSCIVDTPIPYLFANNRSFSVYAVGIENMYDRITEKAQYCSIQDISETGILIRFNDPSGPFVEYDSYGMSFVIDVT